MESESESERENWIRVENVVSGEGEWDLKGKSWIMSERVGSIVGEWNQDRVSEIRREIVVLKRIRRGRMEDKEYRE